jgi:hypothetical protein
LPGLSQRAQSLHLLLSQHTPSTQCPDAQSDDAAQASPSMPLAARTGTATSASALVRNSVHVMRVIVAPTKDAR